jgi:plasmid stabilization system protein ParE
LTRRKKQSKKAVVELTRRALSDLRQIEIYSVQEWGRKAADNLPSRLQELEPRLVVESQLLQALNPEQQS